MPGISYDDSGSLASYFGVTTLALLLLPATWYTLRPAPRDKLHSLCGCSECVANNKRKRKLRSAANSGRLAKRLLFVLAGWAVFAYLAYGLYLAGPGVGNTVYNPFEILGITDSATEKEIKKHYKKLSLQFHPDKIKLGENETMADAEAKFVDLTKAYKSLTDEGIRENLVKYGNPDGPQQREDKIAIPKWVVEGQSSAWVLLAYGVVLGLGIPFVVGRWWFRQRALTRDGILNGTAEAFFHQVHEDSDVVNLITVLSTAHEFRPALEGKRGGSKKQRKERQARIEELEKTIEEKREELLVEESPTIRNDSRATVTTAVARRARALLWAHLLRIELEPELQEEQLAIIRLLPPLLNGLTNIALAHNWLKASLACYQLQAGLVQAVPVGTSPLAELPGISLKDAQELAITKDAEGRRWLERYIKADVPGHDEANKIAKKTLKLDVVSAEFKVTGEKSVTPGAIVNLVTKLRFVYPNTVPATNGTAIRGDSVEAVEGAVEPKEGELDEKKELKEKLAIVDEKKPAPKKNGKAPKPTPQGYAHAPHWPADRKAQYYVLLGDSKLDKVIVQPMRVADIPLPNADGTPSEPKEYSLQFQAPPSANLYSFVQHFSSDTFVGADVARPIMLRVEESTEEESDDDDISEPEEDSLAGQMALMRGEKVKPSGVHGGGDESEYETDTSSDEEGPRRGRAINEDTDSDED
ncbi:secretory subunit [Vanrija albida]|uniref:Secretory subunit n=1 Tax=Vanrija albida TaxID=181172 RepID=A0ABR3PUZ8_9TREE